MARCFRALLFQGCAVARHSEVALWGSSVGVVLYLCPSFALSYSVLGIRYGYLRREHNFCLIAVS